jgi:adenosylcobinamide kinase/adenosylcobinamide-phosphate guanylyltransferase
VLGGARSGKSGFAEKMAFDSGLDRHYVATGRPFDDEMRLRITQHQADRGEGWTTHETTVDLAPLLAQIDRPSRVILVDCLTLWVTNLMMEEMNIEQATDAIVKSLSSCSAKLVLVSNEVGMGIVPDNRMAREFRDHAGRLHQRIAAEADEVIFMAAGLPLKMKG